MARTGQAEREKKIPTKARSAPAGRSLNTDIGGVKEGENGGWVEGDGVNSPSRPNKMLDPAGPKAPSATYKR